MPDNLNILAEEMFKAYNASGPNPGLAYDGKPVPAWHEIAPEKRDQIHAKWRAAAQKAAHMVTEFMRMSIMRHTEAAIQDAHDATRAAFGVDSAPAITYSGDSA